MEIRLTLDDDVVAMLEAAAGNRSLSAVVNETLRLGLTVPIAPAPSRTPYRTRGFDLGPSLVGRLDNVEDVLASLWNSPPDRG